MNIFFEVTPQEMDEENKKIFGPTTTDRWSRTPAYNHVFLNAQKHWFNDLVFVRGHVFLNEVYDALGLPRTKLGAVIGWQKQHVVDIWYDETLVEDDIHLIFNAGTVIINDL